MGCDIHTCVEQFTDGKWTTVYRPIDPNNRYDKYIIDYPLDKYELESKPLYCAQVIKGLVPVQYSGRNYELFGMLAGVRTNEFPQMKSTSGVPLDASAGYTEMWESYGNDGHSHHYISLTELLRYQWDATANSDCTFSRDGILRYLKTQKFEIDQVTDDWRKPRYYPNSETMHDLLHSIAAIEALPSDHNVSAIIPLPYWYFVNSFYTTFLPTLRNLAANKSTDDVRLCFFFDN